MLIEIIQNLAKEEVRHFKLYAQRMNYERERLDIALFDLIRKNGEQFDEDKWINEIYKNNKNGYYRLKNRLLEDIYSSQLLLNAFRLDNLNPLNWLTLAKLYYDKGLFDISHHFLKKAEKKALSNHDLELLDVIYSLFIKLSIDIMHIDPNFYISKRQNNNAILSVLRELNDVLASITYKLKISQNYDPYNAESTQLLEALIDKIESIPEARKNSSIRLKVFDAVSKLLVQTRDYQRLEELAQQTYHSFEDEGMFNQSNHEEKLKLITYIVNASFKNKHYDKSLAYSEILGQAIEQYDRLLYDKYFFFYVNSLVINYSQVDTDKAITLLEDLKRNDAISKQSFYQLFIYSNLAVFYFQVKRFHLAIRQLTQLYIHDSYKTASEGLKCKLAVAELIVRVELNDWDVLEKRLKQVKKDFKNLIDTSAKESAFLEIVLDMAKGLFIAKDEQTLKKAAQFLLNYELDQPDDEIINYAQWLKSWIQR
jgi:hypothetical protein